MNKIEGGPMAPGQARTEEERQEALRSSAEALEKSKAAYQLYLEAYQGWQEKGGRLTSGKNLVDNEWIAYTEAYNDYLETYRKGGGTLGYQEKPYPQRHE